MRTNMLLLTGLTNRRTGFTLVEVLMGIALIMVSLVAILYLTALPSVLNRQSMEDLRASRAIRDEIERIRKIDFNALSSGSFSNPNLTKLPGATGNRTVTNYGGSTKMKQVTLAVTWVDPRGQRTVSSTVLLSRM